MTIFFRFSCFPSLGKPIFSVFHASQVWEMRFSAFFHLSEGSEMRFSAFFVFPRGWKCNFHRFLSFRGVGNAIFGVFRLSEGLEMRFSAFFIFPRGWKCGFWHFSSFQPLGSRKMLKSNSCYFRTATNVFSCENVVEVLVRIAL